MKVKILNKVHRGLVVMRTLAESSLPNSNTHGLLFMESGRNVPGWYDGDGYEYLTYVDPGDVKTSPTTISNDDTEKIVNRDDMDSGALVENRLLILRTFGKYNTASGTDDFTYRVYIGDSGFDPTSGEGNKIAEITTVQENVTDGPWQAKTTITIRSTGQSGTAAVHMEGSFNNNKRDSHEDPVSIDTTSAEDVVTTVDWNNAKAGNSVTVGQSYLQQQA